MIEDQVDDSLDAMLSDDRMGYIGKGLQFVGDLIHKPTIEWDLEDLSKVTFKIVEDAEQFFNSYAFIIGFSIRRDRLNVVGNVIRMRNFVCSKEGFRREKKKATSTSSSYNRLVTRCGCLASFKVKYSGEDNLYHPVEFNTQHNHVLAPSNWSHFLRSQRGVDEFSAQQIADLRQVGIKPSKIMNVLVNSAGGYEWVGFTRKDLYNHVYMTEKVRQRVGDTHLAMQYIQAVAIKDPGVYCRYHSDDECRLARIFYSDTISRTEYRAFGDVVICDSTYKTNEYKLPFVFIVGVDNHHSTIVFACALLSDETHDAYQWVFQEFLNCMEGKQPRSIITDGDRAMRSAIAQVMPKTRHRLCGWHLLRNSIGVCKDPTFKTRLNRLITKRYPVAVFSHKWETLLQQYGLDKGDRKWVTEMQQSCHLWAETFFQDCFFAGTVTNGRAESTNRTLKTFVNIHLPLSQLFHKYLMFLDNLRQTAMGLECLNLQKMPPMTDNGFESVRTQLSHLYTLELYKMVDEQICREHLFRAELLNLTMSSSQLRFSVQRYDSGIDSNTYDVTWVRTTNYLSCSCGMMECNGYPCSHIFSVMKQRNTCQLGPHNLTSRWMKDARSLCMLSSSYASHVTGPAHRLTAIRPYCDTLAYLASGGDEQFHLAQREIEMLCQHLSSMGKGDQNSGNSIQLNHHDLPNGVQLGDPLVVKTKGAPRGKRATTPRHCTYCKEPGHTRTTCEQKKHDESMQNKSQESQPMQFVSDDGLDE